MNEIEVGDSVTWTSQAGGNTKTKTGTVVAIVPPEMRPDEVGFPVKGCGFGRKRISYVVEVKRKKSVLRYWPVVSCLKVTP